jgi:tetrahydromethanopterin S-methyltransferase subunit A
VRVVSSRELDEAVTQIGEATAAKKCWTCGCLHESLAAVEKAYEGATPALLAGAMTAARAQLAPARYDCLGCEVCYPALAVNALNGIEGGPLVDLGLCPTEKVEERSGWPPLPGSYVVNRYAAPVAVCALTSEKLSKALSERVGPEVSVVGTLDTENLGIERLITNVIANPNIRALVVCGADSKQAVGHLPGQSLVALPRARTPTRRAGSSAREASGLSSRTSRATRSSTSGARSRSSTSWASRTRRRSWRRSARRRRRVRGRRRPSPPSAS